MKPLVVEIPWLNGERAEYVLYLSQNSKRGIQLGEIVVENRLSAELEDEHVVLTTRTKLYNPDYVEEVTVFCNKRNYRPLFTHAILHTPGGETIKVKGEYKRKRVEIFIDTANGMDKTKMNVPLDVFDNYQAHFLMRALIGKDEGYSTSISAVHILKRHLVHPWLKVEGKDIVEVPAGTFACWRISSAKKLGSEVQQNVLFSEQEPYPMIKNIRGPQIIELTKYVRP